MSNEVIRLSLCRKEVDIILEAEDGTEKKWKLKELSGTDRNKYLNKMASRVKLDRDGKASGIKSFDGFQADLLGLSLFDEAGTAITVAEIEGLPSSTQQDLFKRAQELSGLNLGADEVKNV